MKRILFVINPASGNTDKSGLKNTISEAAKTHGFDYHVFETTGKNDQQKIKSFLKQHKPEAVFVAGGDGTVNLTGELLTGSKIPLGIIPMGSANGLASELNIPPNPEQAIEVLLKGNYENRDSLLINDHVKSFHLSDLGMNARIIKRFEKEGIRGWFGYFKQFYKEFRNIQKFRCTIKTESGQVSHKALMVVLATGFQYGTGAIVNSTGKPDDGKFEIILIKPYRSKFFFKMAIAFFMRKLHKMENVIVLSATEADIEVKPAQDLQVDGELQKKTEQVKVRLIPGDLLMIRGSNP
ncbi:MAG: NAD(+)/NADH kinase [Bacteroidales bacterium]|nr:NAD(+)/NADH kinase [Bacteroidales bacterium]